MSSQVVGQGIYAGLVYTVVDKDGKRYVGLPGDAAAHMLGLGANLKLLDDIGDQDPEDAMAALFESIPKETTQPKPD